MDRKRAWKSFRGWLGDASSRRPENEISPDEVERSAAADRDTGAGKGQGPAPSAAAQAPVFDRTWTRAAIDGAAVGELPVAGEATFEAALTLDTAAEEAELLDFLAADLDPVEADPVFRERLREDLWNQFVAGREPTD